MSTYAPYVATTTPDPAAQRQRPTGQYSYDQNAGRFQPQQKQQLGQLSACDLPTCKKKCKNDGFDTGHCERGGTCVCDNNTQQCAGEGVTPVSGQKCCGQLTKCSNGKCCSKCNSSCGGATGNCKLLCTCDNSGKPECREATCKQSTGLWDNSACPDAQNCAGRTCDGNKCTLCGGTNGCVCPSTQECIGGKCQSPAGCPADTPCGGRDSNCNCSNSSCKCPEGRPCCKDGACARLPEGETICSKDPEPDCTGDCKDEGCACTKGNTCCGGHCTGNPGSPGICSGTDDGGNEPGTVDVPCMACSGKGSCQQGYECITMTDGKKCCQPGTWLYDYDKGNYTFDPKTFPDLVGFDNLGYESDSGGMRDLSKLFDTYYGADNIAKGGWQDVLKDLEKETGKDINLQDVDKRTKDLQSRLTQNIQGMGGMPALSLLQSGQGLNDMEGSTQEAIMGLLAQPKGYSPQEEELVLQRMRERIGSEYDQAAEGQKANLGERGLLESGLGAYETGVARRGAAEQMGSAARDVAIENLQKKWEQQTQATGLAKEFTKQQQDYFLSQQERDLRRQLEERGWSKDQIDRQIAEVEMQNSFMTKQQQLDLEAQIASQEQKYKGFSLRQSVLGDEADWVLANRTLDMERAKLSNQSILDRNEFKLKRELAIEQLKQDAAKFGLSVQELEATINTKRMEITQQSTALLLQYIAAIMAAAGGG